MGKRNNNNLIYVNIQQSSGSGSSSIVKTTEITEITGSLDPFYTLNQLKALKWRVKLNRTLTILPPTTCKVIRHLRIQRRKKCRSHGKDLYRCNNKTRTVSLSNLQNLRHIEALTRTDPSHNSALTLVNTQSLKNKDTIQLDHLIEMKTDICIVTETWLKENDDSWLECSDISRNGYKIQTHNRNIRKGGGLAIMYRSNLNVSVIEANQTRSMEYAIWKVNTGTVIINIIAIYHPPYSDINQSTNAMFLDDLADSFVIHLMSLSNIIVVGDFNLHIDKKNDPVVNLLKEMVQAFGLDCQVNLSTHQSGHTLDLILTETIGDIKM